MKFWRIFILHNGLADICFDFDWSVHFKNAPMNICLESFQIKISFVP